MKIRAGWLGAGLFAAAVAAAIHWAVRVPQGADACVAGVTWPIAYELAIDEATRRIAAPDEKKVYKSDRSSLKAQLLVGLDTEAKVEAGRVALVARMQPLVRVEGGKEYRDFKAFRQGLVVEIDASCRISRLQFDGRETFLARSTMQRVLAVLDLGRSSDENARVEDQFGTWRFDRRQDGDVVTQSRRELVARRASAVASEWVRVTKVERSALSYRGPAHGLWHDSITASETLRAEIGEAGILHELDYRLTLTRQTPASSPQVASARIPDHLIVQKRVGEPFSNRDRASTYDDVPPNQEGPSTLAEAIERLVSLLDEDDPRGAKLVLIEFLRRHPEAAEDLRQKITDEYFNDQILVHVLHAMARSGLEAAQAAFAALIRDEGVGPSTKIRVLFAVGEVRVPGPGLVAAVREAYQDLKQEGASFDETKTTALLASGIVASALRDVSPSLVDDLKADMLAVLERSTQPSIRANAIDAIGNSELVELAPQILSRIEQGEEVERIAALSALPRLAVEGREAILAKASTDGSVAVRDAAYAGLGMVGISSQQVVQQVVQALAVEQAPSNRARAVDALARAASRMPEARQAVLEHLRTETNPDVMQAAGRYLSAYELSKVMSRRGH